MIVSYESVAPQRTISTIGLCVISPQNRRNSRQITDLLSNSSPTRESIRTGTYAFLAKHQSLTCEAKGNSARSRLEMGSVPPHRVIWMRRSCACDCSFSIARRSTPAGSPSPSSLLPRDRPSARAKRDRPMGGVYSALPSQPRRIPRALTEAVQTWGSRWRHYSTTSAWRLSFKR